MRGVSLTQGTMRFLRQALEGFGLAGAVAFGCEGLRLSWRGESRHRALGPGKVQDDKKPDECEQDELRENMMRHHGVVPLQQVLRWGILPGCGGDGIIRRVAVHDPNNSVPCSQSGSSVKAILELLGYILLTAYS